MQESRVFVHNVIDRARWRQRLTSANKAERDPGRANIEQCIRMSQAVGGNSVLIVVGTADDSSRDEIQQRRLTKSKKTSAKRVFQGLVNQIQGNPPITSVMDSPFVLWPLSRFTIGEQFDSPVIGGGSQELCSSVPSCADEIKAQRNLS